MEPLTPQEIKNDTKQIPYLSIFFKISLIYLAYLLIKSRAWVGEDAFIFFKYVDNFAHGNGLVFNLGERVEGFTAPLWVFLLSLIRVSTNYELRPTAIILGFVLSLGALTFLLFKDNKEQYIFPLGFIILISNSSFRDFATSGFETALTYLLLIVFAVNFKVNFIRQKVFLSGMLLSLLILNRPESFLLYTYVFFILLFNIRKTGIGNLIKYMAPFVLTVIPYQIFRMGYYASLLPNTFYAKKGGEFYISQGINYISDFTKSYPLSLLALGIFTILLLINLFKKIIDDEYSTSRLHLLIMSIILLTYVLYSGGDYMHGRSLLMFFILWVVSINDLAEKYINNLITRIKGTDLERPLMYTTALGALFIVFFILKAQLPITAQQKKQINFINDERSHFGVTFDPNLFEEYLKTPITGEFSWRDRGYYYKDIAEVTGETISVNMANIGFFGYAAGDNVNVMGATLIDPIISRQKIGQRGKIGHENPVDIVYVLSRKPTFSYTPFRYWNTHAHVKYNKSQYSGVITDDSNDSFIPVFDLSNQDFLKEYSMVTGVNVKANVDLAQIKFLNEVTRNNMGGYDMDVKNYFSFLKVHWYPYASETHKSVYDKKRAELFGTQEILGEYEEYAREDLFKTQDIWSRITGDLNTKKFVKNIFYALRL